MSFLDTIASIITIILWALSVIGTFGSPYREIIGFFSVFIFEWLVILLRFRKVTIYGNYRLFRHPGDLDLVQSRLNSDSGERIELTISHNVEHTRSLFCQILKFLGFKLLINIEATQGLEINYERSSTDFQEVEFIANKLVLCHDVDIEGRRGIDITVMTAEITSLRSRGTVDINLYVSYTNPVLRWVCINLIGSRGSINIEVM
jgi:hypothetical protein